MSGLQWRCLLIFATFVIKDTSITAARLRLNEHAPVQPVPAAPAPGADSTANDRPLIGILSQPGSPAPKGSSYIAASYVKFVESAGARAVPILYDAPAEDIAAVVSKVNGLLLPGGGAAITPGHRFYDAVAQLVNLTIAANDAGEYFPLHGTCLGLEALAIVVSGGHRVLGTFNSEDNPSALLLTQDALGSRFYGGMPASVLSSLQASPLAMENHQAGLAPSALDEFPKLHDFFRVTALSADRDGAVYVASMEAHDYPITATQWHPEKNAFEFAAHLHIPHSQAAVRTPSLVCMLYLDAAFPGRPIAPNLTEKVEVTHAVAMFLVGEARKNQRRPNSQQEEDELMIYNYPVAFTGRHKFPGEETDFEESYFFDDGRTARAKSA